MSEMAYVQQDTMKDSRVTKEATASSHKGTQSAKASSHIPLYTKASENQPPPGFSLRTNHRAKLGINHAGDANAQEGDRAVEQVMVMRDSSSSLAPDSETTSAEPSTVSSIVDEALQSPSHPLERDTRTFMESHLEHNFSNVRIHSGNHAAQAAQVVQARAFTVGQDVVLGANEATTGSPQYQHLIAHELVHTLQQRSGIPAHLSLHPVISMPTDPAEIEAEAIATAVVDKGHIGAAITKQVPAKVSVSTGVQPGLIQRQGKQTNEDPAVTKAKERLIKKFDLGSVTEEHGARWSVAQLNEIYDAFSKIKNKAELAELKGLDLIRTDKLSQDYKGHRALAGLTAPTGQWIRLPNLAFKPGTVSSMVILHEVGHVIRKKVFSEAEAKFGSSKVTTDLNKAREKFNEALDKLPKHWPGDQKGLSFMQAFSTSINQVTVAADELQYSKEADQVAKLSLLMVAHVQCEQNRKPVEQYQEDPLGKALLQVHNLQRDWVEAVKKWADEKTKILGPKERLTSFVDIVKKHHLARLSFKPFTPYVKVHWPEEPEEFLVQTYATWRTDPTYLKENAKPLYDWFRAGGHLQ